MHDDQIDMGDFDHWYNHYFDIVRADTPILLDTAYKLRYQVYCVENPFENPEEQNNSREIDGDDDRSIHALLLHKVTGSFAGTVRVILPGINGLQRLLPIHRILASQNPRFLRRLPEFATAEISRFAVSKEFRRRVGENRFADVAAPSPACVSPRDRRIIPYITFGLIRGVLEICLEHEIEYICAVMEPALIRILGRFGLHFEQIGAPVEHHGMRQPCVARLEDLVQRNRTDGTLLWQYTAACAAQHHRGRLLQSA